ncbi:MAG: fumarylacetoacetate hydrolase family protein, partial [Alphaproteobacteria bacterium]|nr:fumarylacetoacetate hydrolase family protein [Alphaproteobacteria bacterium]
MRLCTIQVGGKPVVGVKMGDGKIVDLSKQMPRGPKTVVEILAGGRKLQAEVLKACAKPKAGATVSEKSAKYLSPIPAPGKILCIGLNYRKHAEETGSPIPSYPVVFTRFGNTLVPHNGKMLSTTHSEQYDWEAELTVVIGKKCRN